MPPNPTHPAKAPSAPARAQGKAVDMGVYGRNGAQPRISSSEIIALVLSLGWLAAVGFVFLVLQPDVGSSPVDFVMTLLAVFLPVALIWVAASAAKTARIMREESARLQTAIDAMRHAYVEQQQMAGMQVRRNMEEKIETLARAQERSEAAIAGITSEPDPGPPLPEPERAVAPEVDAQPGLALGTPAEELPQEEPLSMADFIRGVNFPENEKDKEGFRTLRRALRDRQASKLIKAAQDILTLLSQDGIYMDDLVPDRAKPDIWRKFCEGERGRPIAALGGIRDRSSLALAAGRMKSDPVFRDTVLHFLRQFDRVVSEVLPEANDVEVSQFANTRTARAFMLLGRVTGTFD